MIIYTSKTEATAKRAFQAAAAGDQATLVDLIEHSFNLEDCDETGNSVLHYAVQGGDIKCIRYLTEIGGLSPTWANQALVTPYDLAHQRSKEEGQSCEIEVYFEQYCGFPYKQSFHNPICRGMHPDPSIIRVEDDYYMVNSSFIYFPCIPISHSRDLVNWNVIGHAVADPQWAAEHLGGLEGGRGFWAPDISYHNGRFYICATLRLNDNVPCFQTQMVTSSKHPQGPYETPVIHQIRGIDPSIFTDDDGRRYMLVNRGARLMEISEDGRKCLTEPAMIWYGSSKHAPEGPHLLKKDGYYYCFLAEGGTGKGHMVTVARSKELYGPYEDCPYNPILHQTDEAAVLQCCGHGKPVSTPDGRWFIVYLCSRFLDGKWGMLGRETALTELTWTPDGWPVALNGRKPQVMMPLPLPSVQTDIMAEAKTISAWMAPRTIDRQHVSIIKDEIVQISGDGRDLCDPCCRSLLLKWQTEFNFGIEFEMFFPPPNKKGEILAESEAGLTLYYDENTFIKFGLSKKRVFVKEYIDEEYVRQESVPYVFDNITSVHLKVVTTGLQRDFYINDSLVSSFERVTCICSEGLIKGKRFTGAAYGVYVYGTDCVKFAYLAGRGF